MLVGKTGRVVRVCVGVNVVVGAGVIVNVRENTTVKREVMVTEGVMVAVGENVGVKNSLANSALVNALSVLAVGVGEPPPVFGITRSAAYNTLFLLLVLAIGITTPMMQAAITARRRIIPWLFIGLLSFH